MTERSNDNAADTTASRRGERWGHALAVLFAPFALAFTGYNFWRLATEGDIYIRNQGRFVTPDYSLYFWATLLFYIVMFVASAIVLLLFLAWATGRLRGGEGNDGGAGAE